MAAVGQLAMAVRPQSFRKLIKLLGHDCRHYSTGRLLLRHKKNEKKKSLAVCCGYQGPRLVSKINAETYCVEAGHKVGTCMDGKSDQHNNIHINVKSLPQNITPKEFGDLLKESVTRWQKAGYLAAWLKVPILQSSLIPVAAQHGFVFHHAENTSSALYRWLDHQSMNKVPLFATHQVGVAGCVVRQETREVLMVQDKNRPFTLWKFPGGLSELSEDISETAEREVYEETGLNTECQGILAFRQQHNQPGAFGRSDLFFVCHMMPLTLDLHPDYDREIAKCQWMEIASILDNPDTSNFTKQICELLNHGIQHGFNDIHFAYRHMTSVYKGLKFKMFFSSLLDNHKEEENES